MSSSMPRGLPRMLAENRGPSSEGVQRHHHRDVQVVWGAYVLSHSSCVLEPVSLDAILPRALLNRLLHRALRLCIEPLDQQLGVVSRDHLFWAPLSTL